MLAAALADAVAAVVVASPVGAADAADSSLTGGVDSFLTLVVAEVLLLVRAASPVEGEGDAEGEASVMAMVERKRTSSRLKCGGYVLVD